MFSNTEIKSAVNFYTVLKKDLHTLLVKERKSPLDYEGAITVCPCITSFEYSVQEENQNSKTYHALVDASVLIENMLKVDVQLWGKTRGIKCIEVGPDHRCEKVVMEIVFQD